LWFCLCIIVFLVVVEWLEAAGCERSVFQDVEGFAAIMIARRTRESIPHMWKVIFFADPFIYFFIQDPVGRVLP
jgi:hypothetical protein